MTDLGFIAHRFGRMLGPDLAPSTLEILLAQKSERVIGVEIDCVVSRDRELVLLHGNRLDESTTLTGWANQYLAHELKNSHIIHEGAKTNEHPFILSELFERLQDHGEKILVQIEAKAYQDEHDARAVVELISQVATVPQNVEIEVISFWPGACERAAKMGYKSRLISNMPHNGQQLCSWVAASGLEGFVLEHPYLTSALLQNVKDHDLNWTSGNLNYQWQYECVLAMEFHPVAVCTDSPLGLL